MRFALVLFAASLCLSAGCHRDGKTYGKVQGRVTSAGKPVIEAVVIFREPKQHVVKQAITGDDGRYNCDKFAGGGLPVGNYEVAVQQPIQEIHTGQPLPPPKPFPKIDPKYFDPGKSGLKLEVKPGDNPPFDIDLKAK